MFRTAFCTLESEELNTKPAQKKYLVRSSPVVYPDMWIEYKNQR
jgi:hypothetical protein